MLHVNNFVGIDPLPYAYTLTAAFIFIVANCHGIIDHE